MKRLSEWLKGWFFPKTDIDTQNEIHSLNIKNIYYVSLIVGIVQTISIAVFTLMNISKLNESDIVDGIVRVGISVALCFVGFIIAGRLLKKPNAVKKHPRAVKFFIAGFIILLIIWSMFVSAANYVQAQQLLTFYTVELVAVLFVKLHPMFTAATIFGSYIINYLILTFGFEGSFINPYNYMMLAVMSVAGAVLNYRLTVNYISEKNKANTLNGSLEIIANHDSNTRLQNRYALNQQVFDYIGKDICIAMGDINSFKAVNDTYGHRFGDDVLKQFADILQEVFAPKSVYRFGGDEFLIIEYGSDIKALKEKLRQVNERFSAVRISHNEAELGCSFGCVSVCPKDSSEFFESLTRADKLLYLEKEKLGTKR